MRAALDSAGYDLIYREYPEGHTWGNWRTHLIEALKHFFGRKAHATGH
jgi:enterochelin esterase family protein